MALLLAFFAFRPPPTTGPFMRDFESYYSAGATWNAGGDPYTRDIWQVERTIPGVVATRDELLPFVGPSAFRPLWSLLARLPYLAAMRVWGVVLGCALIVLVLGSLALAGAQRDPRTIAAAFLVAFASGPIISDIALGQVALVAAAAVVAAVFALRSGSLVGATIAIAFSAIQPNIALVLLARIRDRHALIAAASAFAIFLGATLVFGGNLGGLIDYVRMLSSHAEAERYITIQHTVTAIAYGFGVNQSAAAILGTSLSVVALACIVVLVRRFRFDALESTAAACAALPLVVPFFHEHDFVIELFPALVLAVRARGPALSFAAAGTVFAASDWLGLSQRANGQWQLLAFVASLSLAFVALSTGARTRTTLIPGIVAVGLILVLAPFAQAHQAPTWPDFLTERWHAPIGWSAAQVWHAEQVASGLEVREATWSLLRALPFLGCLSLLTAFAVSARGREASP